MALLWKQLSRLDEPRGAIQFSQGLVEEAELGIVLVEVVVAYYTTYLYRLLVLANGCLGLYLLRELRHELLLAIAA